MSQTGSSANAPTPQTEWERWFSAVWAQREDDVYGELFGKGVRPNLMTLPEGLFQQLGLSEIDPRWLHHGVLEYPPTPQRPCYAYVTTALSNPWGLDPAQAHRDKPTGLGLELAIYTRDEAPWARSTLAWLAAMQILVASGRVSGDLLEEGAIVPLGTSIDPSRPESPIQYLVIVNALDSGRRCQLDSGWFELLLAIGITKEDRDAMLDDDGERLLEVWKRTLGITNPA